jgi:tape measure domain-containing protein
MNNSVDFQINIGGNATVSLTNIANQFDAVEKKSSRAYRFMKEFSEGLIAFNQAFELAGNVSSIFQSLSGAGLEFEKQQTNLLTLLNGNAEAAERLSESITRYGSATPYDRTSLLEAQKTMMSFGLDADFAFQKLKNIGDIALGDKEKMKSLALAFSQATASGKLMGQDLMQMINAGFNPLEVISRKTGESIAQLKERMSAGGISAEELAEAFQTATQEGERFYQGAERAGATTAGRLEQIRDWIENQKISLFQATNGAIAYIGELANIATPMTSVIAILPQISQLFGGVRNAVAGANNILGLYNKRLALGKIASIGFVQSQLQAAIAVIRFATVGIFSALKSMGAYVLSLVVGGTASGTFATIASGAFATFATSAKAACKAVGVAIKSIPVIGWVIAAIAALGSLFAYAYQKCDKLAATLSGIGSAIKAVFSGKSFEEAYKEGYERKMAERAAERAAKEKKEEIIPPVGTMEQLMQSGQTEADTTAVPQTVERDTSAIATGGTRNNTINIHLGTMVENIVFNGGVNENRDSMVKQVEEALLQVLLAAQSAR